MSRRTWIRAGLALLVVVGGVTAFYVFYHPPMRLMPAPLLFQKAEVPISDVGPALEDGARVEVFYASNRFPIGPRDDRIYSVAPDTRLPMGRASMRIGDEGSTLDQIFEWSTGAERTDRPFIHLQRMTEQATMEAGATADDDPSEDVQRWLDEIDAQLAKSRHKDILVYVHGANTTVERAAGQASQLRHFSGRNAVVVVFVWPTAENFLRYGRDVTNAYASAPRLADLIALLARHTSAHSVDVMTYSAGGTVGSTGLAHLARAMPDAAARVGEVYHAAPDADFRRFVDDMTAYAPVVGRVTMAVNMADSALRLAEVMNRGSRAGRPDLRELDAEAAAWVARASADYGVEVLQVRPENMPEMPARSHTFWYDDPWVSNDLLLLLLFDMGARERALQGGLTAAGTDYWTFPPDYPAAMPAVRDAAKARLPRP
jgi:esterase/lipase superfamily enzyme